MVNANCIGMQTNRQQSDEKLHAVANLSLRTNNAREENEKISERNHETTKDHNETL